MKVNNFMEGYVIKKLKCLLYLLLGIVICISITACNNSKVTTENAIITSNITNAEKQTSTSNTTIATEEKLLDKETIIKKIVDENLHGLRSYIVTFQLEKPITLKLSIPDKFSIRSYNDKDRKYADIDGFVATDVYSVCISNDQDKSIGGISVTSISNVEDFLNSSEHNIRALYQGIMGGNYDWSTKYNCIVEDDTKCTATTYICYPDFYLESFYPEDISRLGNLKDQGNRYFFNKGILSYNLDILYYAGIEFDFDCISDEQLETIAKSIKFV